jgi:hypothetical protein
MIISRRRLIPVTVGVFRLLVLCSGCFFALPEIAKGADGDADSQFWHETRFTYKINDQYDVFALGGFRLTDDFSEFGRASGRIGSTWSPTSSFSLTPSYQYSVNDPGTSQSNVENRLALLAAYRLPIVTATLTLSNTVEFRLQQNLPNSWRLRPKITASNPIGPKTWNLSAFAANELFYDTRLDAWTQDRVFAGATEKINDNVSMELFYCRIIRTNGSSPDANIIGFNVNITFGVKKGKPEPYEPDFQ